MSGMVKKKCCCCACECECSFGMSECDPCGAPPFLVVDIDSISINNAACCENGIGAGFRVLSPVSTFSAEVIARCGTWDNYGHIEDNGQTVWTYSERLQCLPPSFIIAQYDCVGLADTGTTAPGYLKVVIGRNGPTTYSISVSVEFLAVAVCGVVYTSDPIPRRILLFEGTLTVASGTDCCTPQVFSVNDLDPSSATYPDAASCQACGFSAIQVLRAWVGSGGTITFGPTDCTQATIVSVTSTCSDTIIIEFSDPVTLADNQNGSGCATRVAFDVEGHYLLPGTGVQISPTQIEFDVDSYTPAPGDTWNVNDLLEWISGITNVYPGTGTVGGPACIVSVDCDGTADAIVTFSSAVTAVTGAAGDASFTINGDNYASTTQLTATTVKVTMVGTHNNGETWALSTATPTWITGSVGPLGGTTI